MTMFWNTNTSMNEDSHLSRNWNEIYVTKNQFGFMLFRPTTGAMYLPQRLIGKGMVFNFLLIWKRQDDKVPREILWNTKEEICVAYICGIKNIRI